MRLVNPHWPGFQWKASSLALPSGFSLVRAGGARGLMGPDFPRAAYTVLGNNVPRFNRLADSQYGLQICGTKQNQALQSEDLSVSPWEVGANGDGEVPTVTPNFTTENGITLTRVQMRRGSTAGGTCYVRQPITANAATMVVAIFARTLDGKATFLGVKGPGSSVSNQSVTGTMNRFTPSLACTNGLADYLSFGFLSSNNASLEGDFLLGAVQLCNSFLGPYVKTTDAAAGDVAETCRKSMIAGDQTEGTRYIMVRTQGGPSGTRYMWKIGSTNRYVLYQTGAGAVRFDSAGAVTSNNTVQTTTSSRIDKYIMRWKNGVGAAVCMNGGSLITVGTGMTLTLDNEYLGESGSAGNEGYHHILEYAPWATALSDAEMQAYTS